MHDIRACATANARSKFLWMQTQIHTKRHTRCNRCNFPKRERCCEIILKFGFFAYVKIKPSCRRSSFIAVWNHEFTDGKIQFHKSWAPPNSFSSFFFSSFTSETLVHWPRSHEFSAPKSQSIDFLSINRRSEHTELFIFSLVFSLFRNNCSDCSSTSYCRHSPIWLRTNTVKWTTHDGHTERTKHTNAKCALANRSEWKELDEEREQESCGRSCGRRERDENKNIEKDVSTTCLRQEGLSTWAGDLFWFS